METVRAILINVEHVIELSKNPQSGLKQLFADGDQESISKFYKLTNVIGDIVKDLAEYFKSNIDQSL